MTRARDLGDFIADGAAAELVVDTTTLVVDSTNNRVGIGTASPSSALDVDVSQNSETNIEITNTNAGSDAQVRTKYTTDGGLFTVGKTSDAHTFGGDAYIHNVDNTNIRFATSDTERMRIDSGGVVNVGTTSGTQPSYFNSFLNVQNNGSTGSHASITITSGSGGFAGLHFGDSDNGRIGQVTYNNSDNSLLFTANNSERFRIASAGQLGIGGATYGTAGQVLTSGGSGAAPTWGDVATSGPLFDNFLFR